MSYERTALNLKNPFFPSFSILNFVQYREMIIFNLFEALKKRKQPLIDPFFASSSSEAKELLSSLRISHASHDSNSNCELTHQTRITKLRESLKS